MPRNGNDQLLAAARFRSRARPVQPHVATDAGPGRLLRQQRPRSLGAVVASFPDALVRGPMRSGQQHDNQYARVRVPRIEFDCDPGSGALSAVRCADLNHDDFADLQHAHRAASPAAAGDIALGAGLHLRSRVLGTSALDDYYESHMSRGANRQPTAFHARRHHRHDHAHLDLPAADWPGDVQR